MVFANPLIWILGAANFFVYVVRFSVLDWGPSLLSQSKGVSMAHAGWLVAMFEIAGILGMLFAGGAFGIGTVVAIVLLAVMLYMLFRPDPYKDLKVYSKRSVQAAAV